MSDLIYPGEIVRITNGDGFQRKPDLTLFDPVDVTLTVRSPSGVVTEGAYPTGTDFNVAKDTTGKYHADITVDESGRWTYQWAGDAVINEGAFRVWRSRVVDAE